MSGPRARSAVPADHRSVHPDLPGVPWWGAVLLAITFTAIGFAYDAGSGSRELGSVFAVCFGLGCVLAVLAVRQSGVFTAVIQPPLLLFVAVPSAYFLFHGSEIKGLKDLAINCGYPLIERFPLMFFTSALVLLIGAARWYLGRSAHGAAAAPAATEKKPRTKSGGLLATVTAKVTAATTPRDDGTDDADDQDEDLPPRRRRTADRPRRTGKPAGERTRDRAAKTTAGKPTRRTGTPSRSRHARPADTEIIEPVVERPRRPRSARTDDAGEPRRRSREQRESRDSRRTRDGQPRERRSRERQPRERQSRENPPPLDRRTAYDRPERRRRYEDYDDFEPLAPNGSANGSGSSTHHPVSRVRYRGDDDGEDRAEYPSSRPRTRRSWDPDSWEYDV
ncbi:hypothetical protein JRC04_18695 [Mycolicibacterium sp. S2-37]|uniref:DUF6542 domain-containing protein n=1 Tax=Mycolicibacterium sp. S2-37 TaxID=2810297 RepID=UPI001A94CD74|nr:DUF6542 domain-containing protein [Mycolicibacterium sp. S2-37]MBO0679496.1 hypothetical protein [Mycolicibacterium sp. S2-37]